MQLLIKVRIFETLRQEDYLKIFIIFVVSKDLSFESQKKSTIFNLNIQNWDFLSNIIRSAFSKFTSTAFSHWICFIINSRIAERISFSLQFERKFFMFISSTKGQ